MAVQRCLACGAVSRAVAASSCTRCRGTLAAGPHPVDATALVAAIVSSPAPVLVEFSAEAGASALDGMSPDLLLLRVDTRREPAAAAAYHVGPAPTLVLFRRGREVARLRAFAPAAVPGWIAAASAR